MKFVAKAQESRERDANMMMRGFVKIQTAKVLCLRLQCLERIRADVLKFTTGTEGQVNGMSDDLISRKDLLGTERLLMTDIVENNKVARYILEQVLYDIEHAPVAFDKGKVAEELDNCRKIMLSPTSKDCFGEECRENDCLACVFNKAMEIVEKGGIE